VSIRIWRRAAPAAPPAPEPGRHRSRVPALIQDSGAVRLVPSEPAATRMRSPQEMRASTGAPRTQKPAAEPPPVVAPAPVITEVWLNRNELVSLQWDYRNLPLFRAGVADKYQLHQLAMRAPRTINGGMP